MKQLVSSLRRAFFVVCAVTLVAAVILPTVEVSAQGPTWVSEADPTYEVIEQNANVTANEGRYCNFESFTIRMMDRSTLKYRDTQQTICAIEQEYGKLGGDFIQFKNDSQAYKIDVRGATGVVPGANSYFFKTNAHQSSFFSHLYAIDNPAAAFEKRAGYNGYEFALYHKEGVPIRTLSHPKTGQPLHMNAIDASANGEWLIVELSAGNLARVNPKTFEMTVFPGGGTYGAGNNPSLDMAISNDGRYVAVGGYRANLTLYDLSTCITPDPASSEIRSTGCGRKELGDFMRARDPQFIGANYLAFNSEATELEFMTKHRVRLTLPGLDIPQLDYLALGDSFSSGEGAVIRANYEEKTDGQLHPKEKCHISKQSYSYLVAQAMGVPDGKFKSVACSGAILEDITYVSPDYLGQEDTLTEENEQEKKEEALDLFTPGRAAQIQFVEKYKPRVVTIGIGGNDIGFDSIIKACAIPLHTCSQANDATQRAHHGNEIARQYASLKKMYESLHKVSKRSKIYAVGYPKFVKEHSACAVNVGFDDTERRFINEGVGYLNKVIAAAAKDAGVGYIDIENSLAGKELCAGTPGALGVNGLVLGKDHPEYFGVIGRESFHPNEIGHAAMAESITSHLPNLQEHDYCSQTPANGDVLCPTGNVQSPSKPEYFRPPTTSPNPVQAAYQHFVSPILRAGVSGYNALVSMLAPGSNVYIEVHSTPLQLGSYTVDENGTLNAAITLPTTLPAGYHTIHILGTTPSGEQVDLYQRVQVLGPEGDDDGDGIANESDPCAFVPPAGVDADRDGIDDACDGTISETPPPAAPSLQLPPYVNAETQNSFEIKGRSESPGELAIEVDDANDMTAAVTITESINEGEFDVVANVSGLDDGTLTVTATLTDEFGTSEPTTITILKDTRPPEVSATPATAPNAAGWHKEDITIELGAKDAGSGITQLTYLTAGAQQVADTTVGQDARLSVTVEGETTVYLKASDKAGNVSTEKRHIAKLDKTPPTASIKKPHLPVLVDWFGDRLTGKAGDSFSGVGKVEVQFIQQPMGAPVRLPATCLQGCNEWTLRPSQLKTGLYEAQAFATDVAGHRSPASSKLWLGVVSNPSWLTPFLSFR